MRVITGLYKGRTIKTVSDNSVRPATDRVKQTIFNMLANRIEIHGATVLDLFAGSGNLGIEALSRGARHATFVELNAEAVGCIEHNLRSLGCEARTEIYETEAMRFVATIDNDYDLIFADPPYAFEETAAIPESIFSGGLLRQEGYLLIEHSPDLRFQGTPLYHAGPEKKFGRTLVTFFQHPRPEAPPA